jgi:ATP-dependent DNA ligase
MIASVDRIAVGTFKIPYFPPRPMRGPRLARWEDVERFTKTHHVQPKLNGDRACLAAVDGKLYLQNRHGAFYRQTCDLTEWLPLKSGTWLLDGEVWKKKFYPFEAVIIDGLDVSATCPSERAERAKDLTMAVNLEWMFDEPTRESIEAQLKLPHTLSRPWEGVVAKRRGSRYVQSGTEGGENTNWLKIKYN